ncbi:MAG TPA: ABC transporter permease [Baekduia sp.]|nr:ABC transporter permease [Baekduia sp.]
MTTLDQSLIAPTPVEAAAPTKVSLWRGLLSSPEGWIGLTLAVVVLTIIVIGPIAAPYDPNRSGVGVPNSGVSSDHLLGTDSFGRDVLSRFLSGGRSVIVVPVIAITIAYAIGASLGMLGAYRGGKTDRFVTRLLDLLLALPGLLIVLLIIAGLGTSALVLIAAVAVVFIAGAGRLVRGSAQAVVTSDYVAAANARGETTRAILVREVLPNISGPIIADFALRLTWAVLFVAGLNFLGLGKQPPSSDWGLMISQGREYLDIAPLATLVPAAGIAALAIAFNLIGDALTRHLSPETRQRGLRL